jgi:hypothetical protein
MPTVAPTTPPADPHRRRALEAVEDAFRRQQYQAERDQRDAVLRFAARLREINPSVTWEQVREALADVGITVPSVDILRPLARRAACRS